MARPEIEWITSQMHSPQSIAATIWGYITDDRDADPSRRHVGVVIGSESACKPLVPEVEFQLSQLIETYVHKYDFELLEVCATKSGYKWALVACIYT